MSTQKDYIGSPPAERKPPYEYDSTVDGYCEWIDDHLGMEPTGVQRSILESIVENQKTVVVAANGIGKTYILSAFTLAFLFSNYPASVLATSGTYRKLKRTYCKPIERFHRQSIGLPGRYLQNPPRITIESEPEVFWESASPTDPGELEGVHNEFTLGIVEEADKDDVDHDVIDSMESLLTNDDDKLVVVANPPKDESNVVYDLMNDSTWSLEQFSSFDSHNVQIERGNVSADPIDEVVTLDQIKQDWQSYNGLAWPGYEEALDSGTRDDLDVRWYRRRLGIIPPQAAEANRPFTVDEVEAAFEREPQSVTATPQGVAWDVARGSAGGDYNALSAIFGDELRMLQWWRHTGEHPHLRNEETVREHTEPSWKADFAIDAVGVGSEAYDRTSVFYPQVVRFDAGSEAFQHTKYANKWTEALCVLGKMLRDGLAFSDERLREEMLTAARVVELEEKYVAKYDCERFQATRKDAIKDRLGRSPDLLDSAAMSAVMVENQATGGNTVPSTW